MRGDQSISSNSGISITLRRPKSLTARMHALWHPCTVLGMGLLRLLALDSRFLLRVHKALPTDGPQTWRVLGVILRRKNVPFCDADFVTATNASVDPGVGGLSPRAVLGLEGIPRPNDDIRASFVNRHVGSRIGLMS
ncbi:MAG: hypothetical protein V4787_24140 [Pseudomonadota bacterium]